MTLSINTDWLLYAFFTYAAIFTLAFFIFMLVSLVSGGSCDVKGSLFAAAIWPRYVYEMLKLLGGMA